MAENEKSQEEQRRAAIKEGGTNISARHWGEKAGTGAGAAIAWAMNKYGSKTRLGSMASFAITTGAMAVTGNSFFNWMKSGASKDKDKAGDHGGNPFVSSFIEGAAQEITLAALKKGKAPESIKGLSLVKTASEDSEDVRKMGIVPRGMEQYLALAGNAASYAAPYMMKKLWKRAPESIKKPVSDLRDAAMKKTLHLSGAAKKYGLRALATAKTRGVQVLKALKGLGDTALMGGRLALGSAKTKGIQGLSAAKQFASNALTGGRKLGIQSFDATKKFGSRALNFAKRIGTPAMKIAPKLLRGAGPVGALINAADAGYTAGTLINKGLGYTAGKLTGGKYKGEGWLGNMLYDFLNPQAKVNSKLRIDVHDDRLMVKGEQGKQGGISLNRGYEWNSAYGGA